MGRALQKHSARSGSVFGRTGNSAHELNAAGQEIVDDILTTPGTRFTPRTIRENGKAIDVIDVVAPDGRGVRFHSSNGSLRGFLEP